MATRKNKNGGSKVDAAVAAPVAIIEESEIVVTDADEMIVEQMPEEQEPEVQVDEEKLETLLTDISDEVDAAIVAQESAPSDDEILAMVEAAPVAPKTTVGAALAGMAVCTECKQAKNQKQDFYMVTKLSGKYRAICKDCYDLRYYGRKHGERKTSKVETPAKQTPYAKILINVSDIEQVIKAWLDDVDLSMKIDEQINFVAQQIMLKVLGG